MDLVVSEFTKHIFFLLLFLILLLLTLPLTILLPLLRFLIPLFLHPISSVVVDDAVSPVYCSHCFGISFIATVW